jgi:copper chaperone CopZ
MRLFGGVLTVFLVAFVSVSAWAGVPGKKTIYLVENMTCGSCLTTISKGVARVAPDARVSGDPSEGVVVVMHDAGVPSETIGQAITESGYPARVMTSVDAELGEKGFASSPVAAGGSCCSGGERPACGGTTESWKALYKAMKERLSPESATAQTP